MPKLYAFNKIAMPDGRIIPPRGVFDATVAQAKQFDALKAARPATEKEIAAAAVKVAEENGHDLNQPELPIEHSSAPLSGAPGDPQGAPKGAKP